MHSMSLPCLTPFRVSIKYFETPSGPDLLFVSFLSIPGYILVISIPNVELGPMTPRYRDAHSSDWASHVPTVVLFKLKYRNLLSAYFHVSLIPCLYSLPFSRNSSPNVVHVANIYSCFRSCSLIFSIRTSLFTPEVEICPHLSLCCIPPCTLFNVELDYSI